MAAQSRLGPRAAGPRAKTTLTWGTSAGMPQPGHGTDSPCKPWPPRSLGLTRVGAGAMENVCRWYGDFLHAVCPVIWSQRCTPRVQRQPRLSTALKRPDLAEHRGTNASTCRVVVGGQPSGNGGEDLRRLGAVVLRACGLGEAVHIGL